MTREIDIDQLLAELASATDETRRLEIDRLRGQFSHALLARLGPSRPPLGVPPEFSHEESRCGALIEALSRYARVGALREECVGEWVDELARRIEGLRSI